MVGSFRERVVADGLEVEGISIVGVYGLVFLVRF